MGKIRVVVGSANPVKIAAVKTAFTKYFSQVEVKGIKTSSQVSDQPVGRQTFVGAKNRALSLSRRTKADYYVGIEGGISQYYRRWFGYGCMCVIDKKGKIGFGTSPWFPLPAIIYQRLLKGEELGVVMDELMNEKNTKHKGGAIGFFTNNVMDRKGLYVQGLIVALVPFIKKELF